MRPLSGWKGWREEGSMVGERAHREGALWCVRRCARHCFWCNGGGGGGGGCVCLLLAFVLRTCTTTVTVKIRVRGRGWLLARPGEDTRGAHIGRCLERWEQAIEKGSGSWETGVCDRREGVDGLLAEVSGKLA